MHIGQKFRNQLSTDEWLIPATSVVYKGKNEYRYEKKVTSGRTHCTKKGDIW
jgi:hypothetical protein